MVKEVVGVEVVVENPLLQRWVGGVVVSKVVSLFYSFGERCEIKQSNL